MMDGLLIDIKNLMYRGIYAGFANPSFDQSKKDYSIVVFRLLYKYFQEFNPKSIHIFWDPPKENLWRKNIHAGYKEGRDYNRYDIDISKEIAKLSRILNGMFKCMGFYQYKDDHAEADDLIYAFCKVHRRLGNYVIISSDHDMVQIPYLFDNVSVSSPDNKKDKIEQVPNYDPVIEKSLRGDVSDNIEGFKGIGKVKGPRLARDHKLLIEYLNKNDGWDKYIFNRSLIDLSTNPDLSRNMLYVMNISSQKPSTNFKMAKKISLKVKGLYTEFNSLISPFQFMK